MASVSFSLSVLCLKAYKQGLAKGSPRFLPEEESCKEGTGRTGLATFTNNLRLQLERRKESFRAEEKPAAVRKNEFTHFSRPDAGFSLCALRTAWPASLACPEAVGNAFVSR